MFAEADLPPILRRFKVVTSAELEPAPQRREEGGGDVVGNPPSQQQVMFEHPSQQCFISTIDFVFTTIQLRILQSSQGSRTELGSCQWRFRLEMILRRNDFDIHNAS